MSVSDISALIASLGFPIVACAALFWYVVTISRELTKAVNNNTEIVNRLLDKMEGNENE